MTCNGSNPCMSRALSLFSTWCGSRQCERGENNELVLTTGDYQYVFPGSSVSACLCPDQIQPNCFRPAANLAAAIRHGLSKSKFRCTFCHHSARRISKWTPTLHRNAQAWQTGLLKWQIYAASLALVGKSGFTVFEAQFKIIEHMRSSLEWLKRVQFQWCQFIKFFIVFIGIA